MPWEYFVENLFQTVYEYIFIPHHPRWNCLLQEIHTIRRRISLPTQPFKPKMTLYIHKFPFTFSVSKRKMHAGNRQVLQRFRFIILTANQFVINIKIRVYVHPYGYYCTEQHWRWLQQLRAASAKATHSTHGFTSPHFLMLQEPVPTVMWIFIFIPQACLSGTLHT